MLENCGWVKRLTESPCQILGFHKEVCEKFTDMCGAL